MINLRQTFNVMPGVTVVGERGPELVNLPRGSQAIPNDELRRHRAKESNMNRAWSVFTIKAFDADERTFEGIATTPSTDRVGDIVEPKGAKFTLPIPMLWGHGKGENKDPIGWVTSAKVTDDGIAVKGKFAKLDEPPSLKEDLDRAWALVKSKLVRGLSIGFNPLESVPIKNSFAERFTSWEWLELSPVAIAANQDASIVSIKSIDQAQMRAASGTARTVALSGSPPGVTGIVTRSAVRHNLADVVCKVQFPKGTTVKTTSEHIASLEAKRAADVARKEAIVAKTIEEGRSFDEAEKQECDDLTTEVKTIDGDLVRYKEHEATMVQKATPITPASAQDGDAASKLRQGINVIQLGKRNLPAGIPWTRFAMCQAMAKGNLMQAEVLSRRFDDSTPEVGLACKAAVAAGTTQDATWAAPLVQLQEMQSEFIEFLRPLTVLGRIPNLRRVPFNIKFTRQTAGTTGTFVGEGLPKPLGKMDFELLSLTWAKAATIIVMTQELVRFSNPSAEQLARDDLAAGIARYLDLRFLDPVYAGVANVSPASITNGVTPTASLGTTVALITDTIKVALQGMAVANLDMQGLVWVMSPAVAISLGLKRTSQDIFGFPGLTGAGGTFFGYPVITSNNMSLSGSPTESFIVLLDPREIMLADDGGVQIDMSTEASVEMSNTPTGGATSLVSLWQNDLVGLRAERFINWRKRRDAAVAVITMNVVW